jgi:hypothetical protein
MAQRILQQKRVQPNAGGQPTNVSGATPQAAMGTPQVTAAPQAQALQQQQAQPAFKRGGIAHLGIGGMSMDSPWWERSEARGDLSGGSSGLLNSPIGAAGGRSDTLPHAIPPDSYVLPADFISGIGQGDTNSGIKVWNAILRSMPYGVNPPSRGQSNAPRPPRLQSPQGQARGGKSDGQPGGKVPVIVANGEVLVHPADVARFGNGDVKKGHKVLDSMVLAQRAKTRAELGKLKPPVK